MISGGNKVAKVNKLKKTLTKMCSLNDQLFQRNKSTSVCKTTVCDFLMWEIAQQYLLF